MPKNNNARTTAETAAAPQLLSDDLADLVNKKILEFEQSCAEESEKSQRAQKGKARAAAKTKLKEAKQLVNSSEMDDAEKVRRLWERLQSEDEQALKACEQAKEITADISNTEFARDESRNELNRYLAVKTKLESLCRTLQKETDALVEERGRLTNMERMRRQELADEFQHTIGDVKTKMDQQAQERARLARENEDLRNKFKQFFEQYDTREKELLEQQRARELEVQVFELKLAEQAQLYRQEAAREQTTRRENEELTSTEEALRGQLRTYSDKFNHFQDALSKSDKVLGQYRRQRNKMQRRVEVLEKENRELRVRTDKKVIQVTKDRDAVLKEKENMQERCKALQAERKLLDEKVEAQKGS